MSHRTEYLTNAAHAVADELAHHPVLSVHWPQISLIMKGSTARGNTDSLSDIDLVLYADESVRRAVIHGYRQSGLTNRQDGIFMFFAGRGYDGHYHIESYDQLKAYYRERDFYHAWEYQTAIALHDPARRFAKFVQAGTQALFADPLIHIKQHYLQLQLDLDWMRHPLKRGDGVAAFLHCAKLVQGVCQISYLLDAQPYPPDKWLIHYLRQTRFGRGHAHALREYAFSSAAAQELTRHLELDQYPLYADASALIKQIGAFISRNYSAAGWIKEWYRYV
jgi:pterin-4a-carbinolamine dehydratase